MQHQSVSLAAQFIVVQISCAAATRSRMDGGFARRVLTKV